MTHAVRSARTKNESSTKKSVERKKNKYVWRNSQHSLCLKCYDAKIYPLVPVTVANIAFHQRLRNVEEWIGKHQEFKTKREACLGALKARGKTRILPESLR